MFGLVTSGVEAEIENREDRTVKMRTLILVVAAIVCVALAGTALATTGSSPAPSGLSLVSGTSVAGGGGGAGGVAGGVTGGAAGGANIKVAQY